jgi:hypothetical protein
MNLPIRPTDNKVRQWCRRYLPSEAAGVLAATLCGLLVLSATGEPVWATTAAVAGESFAYYGVIFGRELRWRMQGGAANSRLVLVIVRDLLLEFGPAELADTLLVRPLMIYAGLSLAPVGWIGIALGKLAADLFFYVLTIAIFELRQGRAAVWSKRIRAARLRPAAVPDARIE